MPRILKDLTINEVSSVDRGAGEGVKVMLMKRAATGTTAKPTPGDIQMTDAELAALVAKSTTEAVTKALEIANAATTVELQKRDHEIALLKMTDAQKAYMSGCTEATQKSFAALNSQDMDKFMTDNPLRKAADPVTITDLAKRDDVVAKLLISNAELQKRLDARDLTDSQALFKKQAADLGLTQEGDGEIMRKAFAGDAAAQATFTKRQVEVVKGLRKQVEEGGLFDTFGTSKGAGGDAMVALVAKASELRAKDPELTEAKAFTKVYEDPANAELVRQQKAEEARGRFQVVA